MHTDTLNNSESINKMLGLDTWECRSIGNFIFTIFFGCF